MEGQSCLSKNPGTGEWNPNPGTYGKHISFDSLGAAFITVFQVITMEGWTDIMYTLQDASSPLFATSYCVAVVVFGAFFLSNVAMAVIVGCYMDAANEDRIR